LSQLLGDFDPTPPYGDSVTGRSLLKIFVSQASCAEPYHFPNRAVAYEVKETNVNQKFEVRVEQWNLSKHRRTSRGGAAGGLPLVIAKKIGQFNYFGNDKNLGGCNVPTFHRTF